MARIRSIKPETFEDELLGALPRDIRLLYIGLWTLADDSGRFRASPTRIRSALFSYDDDLSQHQVTEWLQILSEKGRIHLYEVGHQQYGVVCRWLQHQKIDHPSPSKLPSPPKGVIPKPSKPLRKSSRGFANSSEVLATEGKGREGSGEERKGSSEPEGSSTPASPTPSPGEVVEAWNTAVAGKLPEVRGLTDDRRRKIQARSVIAGRDRAWWRSLFESVASTPFLVGENDRGWKATIDFVIRSEQSVMKILEGAYASSRASPKRGGLTASEIADHARELERNEARPSLSRPPAEGDA